MRAVVFLTALFAMILMVFASAAGEEKVYEEGTVWSVSFVRTEANMQGEYIKDLAKMWRKVMQAAKDEGLVLSYKVLAGESANPDDWDIMLLAEFKNYAMLDGLGDKIDEVAKKMIGTEDQQMEANKERGKIRDIFGSKLMWEVVFK